MSDDLFEIEIPMFVAGCECDHCQRARHSAWLLGMFQADFLPPPPRQKYAGEVGYAECCPWLSE